MEAITQEAIFTPHDLDSREGLWLGQQIGDNDKEPHTRISQECVDVRTTSGHLGGGQELIYP